MKKAIIIFTRVPIPGKTKTRMMPFLTPDECVKIHSCFLKDIITEVEKINADIFIYYTPEGSEKILYPILGENKPYFLQIGNDIGEKMSNSFKEVFRKNYDSCLLIGTDLPEINKNHFKQAFENLKNSDIVFGPSVDGGYYLVGMNQFEKKVFEKQSYGHRDVLSNTVYSLQKEDLKISYINKLNDIDTPEDLKLLIERNANNDLFLLTETGKYLNNLNKISIIIPIYNEEKTIVKLQNQLLPYINSCEIIFVDGGSTDNTLNLINKKFTLIHSKKGRQNQMNYGALKSNGNILFFLHSDSVLPNNFLNEINSVMKKYPVACFGVKFPPSNFFMLTNRVLSNFRAKYRRIIFGDQGMFIKRDLFFSQGMFPDLPIMEDYQFSLNLRKDIKKFGMAKNRILTSDRRYPKGSIPKLKLMWKMYKLRKMYRKGVNIEIISNKYKDIR